MLNKVIVLHFNDDESWLYDLLKSKVSPTSFIAETVKAFDNKGTNINISKDELISLLGEVLDSHLSKISVAEPTQVKEEPHEIGQVNLDAIEDTTGFDFSSALAALGD